MNLAKQIGGQFRGLIDPEGSEMDTVIQGFADTMKGELAEDPNVILATYGQQLNNILQERASGVVDKMKAEGDEFLAGFMDVNEEAVKTDSGMAYLSMVEGEFLNISTKRSVSSAVSNVLIQPPYTPLYALIGTGASPTIDSTVEVHYHGQLTDGTVFDSSVQRGQTISFPLGNVIKGWQEGLQLMKEGGKATLVIPSDLAYGEGGSGETIPPGATLKFEVELFKVQ